MNHYPLELHVSKTPSASVTKLGEDGWHLEIPAGSHRRYYLAQLDDHSSGIRSNFRWQPPLTFSLQARVSAEDIPGTWGFGLWNDPFGFLLGYEGVKLRLPSLPEAAWFFHASPQNYLSFKNDSPANGFLAATFNSSKMSSALLALGSPVLALAFIPGAAQGVRKLLQRLVKQDAFQIHTRLTDWHGYSLVWEVGQVRFYMDNSELFRTVIAPRPNLTLVIWIDNQYAALPPRGRIKYGYLLNPQPAWLEIRGVAIQSGA